MLNAEKRILTHLVNGAPLRLSELDPEDRAICKQMIQRKWILHDWNTDRMLVRDAGRAALVASKEEADQLAQQQAREDARYRRRLAAERLYAQQDIADQKRHDCAVALLGSAASFFLDSLCTGNSIINRLVNILLELFQP